MPATPTLDYYVTRKMAALEREMLAAAKRDAAAKASGLMPISQILAEVPGDNVQQQAATIGVSRTTIEKWLAGKCRPAGANARRISELTGFAVEAIISEREAALSGGRK